MPTKINTEWQWSSAEINELIEKAALKLGELNALSRFVPSVDAFIHMHVTQEAVLSSEGIQTNISEALLPENEIQPKRRGDWKEVRNYIRALEYSI
ncbi:hypothetical protein JCM31826_01090 [Thermaurantimonas aggregans]|uniref:Fic/DOC N-terminal domain-containing protein n=1 Tax=Thermaurantimonas aggregans TaxID=2173829 RepID=A0A401XHY9_9FLAO|nr:Fic/DOC family N-terminal domain-containing protein [Thermaurantimonas aggregans]MCX8149186.1 hypothetical protein [Thermaurantimonas aggregans]GCD76627.1 hypothetical protein JCM31826_01090 [Thermaurantimonas aggregans]